MVMISYVCTGSSEEDLRQLCREIEACTRVRAAYRMLPGGIRARLELSASTKSEIGEALPFLDRCIEEGHTIERFQPRR